MDELFLICYIDVYLTKKGSDSPLYGKVIIYITEQILVNLKFPEHFLYCLITRYTFLTKIREGITSSHVALNKKKIIG